MPGASSRSAIPIVAVISPSTPGTLMEVTDCGTSRIKRIGPDGPKLSGIGRHGRAPTDTFYRLILPMSVPVLAAFAIFQFLWTWNDLLVALVFIGPGENQPITVAVNQLLGQQGQGWSLVTAGGLFSMILPIIVFLSMQRFFVRGLTAGSVKG